MNQDLSPEQMRAVIEAIQRGSKIEAIKHYREATSLGLAESKDAIDALVESVPSVSGPPPFPQLTGSPTGGLTPDERNAVIGAIRRGNKIEAIRIYREATGLGLAESKDAVEAMESSGASQGHGSSFEARTPLPHWDPLAEKKKGCFGMIAVLIALVVAWVLEF